ncbi:MAG: ABC transporter substrate-binding protein [Oscillospiraceae bacterium]|jgi:branched-chain amino acid transport system substrate-binding protein|nr:ABC transporter substrate-binding protein [Oscillospiraceae bacterium]
MKKKWLALLLALIFAIALLAGCNSASENSPSNTGSNSGSPGSPSGGSGASVEKGYQKDMQKDTIEIYAVRPVTGDSALFQQTAFGPQYKMWEDEINKDGGLYVKSLDRKVQVHITTIDDTSDMEKTRQLLEQVLANNKPDLILAPEGTARLFAAAPIAQKYGYLMIAAEGGAKDLAKEFENMRNYGETVGVFSVLSYSETQVPALVKLFEELGVKSVYCAYINDLHGIEYWNYTEEILKGIGIEIKGSEPVDPAAPNGDVIINNAMSSGADAFLGYMYPPQAIPVTMTARALNYVPKMYLLGPGLCYDFFSVFAFDDFSQDSLHGIMGWGGWNEKSSDRAKAYSEHFRSYWIEKGMFWKNADGSPNFDAIVSDAAVFQDWWGHICYYSVMQVLQQAVENAGELDSNGILKQSTLIDYVANNTFDTVMHPALKFTDNILLDDMYLGNVGQWQNRVFEVIDNDSRRTADPIFPFPGWWQG